MLTVFINISPTYLPTMKKISIISGTHRKDSKSAQVAKQYSKLLAKQNIESKVLDLSLLPAEFLFAGTFGNHLPELDKIIEEHVVNFTDFVFVVPEYNGSFPGSLKAFIDCVEPKFFHNKKAGLVGISSGRAGNLRGLDHLTGILHYLQVEVMSAKPKLSQYHTLVDHEDNIIDEATLKLLENHVEKLLNF